MEVNMGDSLQPICLIDDDLIFGESFRRQRQKLMLKNVEMFNNFEEVRKAKDLEKYSCFVVDYDLEDETGIEVAKFLQEKVPFVPVVIVSATNRPWDERHDDLENVKAFVSKWSGLNTVVTLVDLVAEGKEFPMMVRDFSENNDLTNSSHGIYLPRIELKFEKYRA